MIYSREDVNKLTRLFNQRPKDFVSQILRDAPEGIAPEEVISNFLYENKDSLDLEVLGDFLGSGELKLSDTTIDMVKLRVSFSSHIDLSEKDFVTCMREFLTSFRLPGEAQKIDRLVEAFATRFTEQNPGIVKDKDSAYTLAFGLIMLNTDLHNPNIAHDRKMTQDGFKRNMRGTNGGVDFPAELLDGIFSEISTKPFKLNFVKEAAGITLESHKRETSAEAFEGVKSPEDLKERFGIENVKSVKVESPNSWLKSLTGFTTKMEIENEKGAKVQVQIYQPGWFSFKNPSIVISGSDDHKKDSLEFTGKVAGAIASKGASVKKVKATFHYQAEELSESMSKEMKARGISSFSLKVAAASTNKHKELSR